MSLRRYKEQKLLKKAKKKAQKTLLGEGMPKKEAKKQIENALNKMGER